MSQTARSGRTWRSAGPAPRPKEAALDYLGDGELGGPCRGCANGGQCRRRPVSRMSRTKSARRLRTTTRWHGSRTISIGPLFAWRHGAAVDAFAAGRQEVVESVGRASREEPCRGRCGGAERDLSRDAGPSHSAAQAGRALPGAPGGLRLRCWRSAPASGAATSKNSRALHGRARRHRSARQPCGKSHRTQGGRPNGRCPQAETYEDVRPAHGGDHRGGVPRTARLLGFRPAARPNEDHGPRCAPRRREEMLQVLAPQAPEPPKPDWRSAWEPVIGEWNALIDRARQSGTIAFYTEGLRRSDPAHSGARGEPGRPGRQARVSGPDPQER